MKVKDVAILAGIVGAGVLVMSKWDEIKGVFEGISGAFGAWGIGPDAPVQPEGTPWFVPPSIIPYTRPKNVPPEQLPEIMPLPPPTIAEFLFPPLALLPHEPPEVPFMPTPPPAPTIAEIIFPPLMLARLLPTPSPPTYTPTVPPVYQPGPVVPVDPGHPSTDPFMGGR